MRCGSRSLIPTKASSQLIPLGAPRDVFRSVRAALQIRAACGDGRITWQSHRRKAIILKLFLSRRRRVVLRLSAFLRGSLILALSASLPGASPQSLPAIFQCR